MVPFLLFDQVAIQSLWDLDTDCVVLFCFVLFGRFLMGSILRFLSLGRTCNLVIFFFFFTNFHSCLHSL